MDTAVIRARLGDLRWMVQQAQADRCPWNATKAKYQASMTTIMDTRIGPMANVIDQIEGALGDDPPEEPAPEEPAPPPQFVAPVPDGAVYGMTKWLPGSSGCDLFLPRGTVVVAPADCTVRYVAGGTGLSGGAELILATDGNTHAWRYRHVGAGVQVGQRVSQGQRVGYVNDDSLDLLGAVPAWAQPVPDGYQHLDLSYNGGTDQFSPQGGGGGNRSAYAWLVMIGYRGRVLARTPGPPDAGH